MHVILSSQIFDIDILREYPGCSQNMAPALLDNGNIKKCVPSCKVKPSINYAIHNIRPMVGDIKMATHLPNESQINEIKTVEHLKSNDLHTINKVDSKSTPSSRVLILKKPSFIIKKNASISENVPDRKIKIEPIDDDVINKDQNSENGINNINFNFAQDKIQLNDTQDFKSQRKIQSDLVDSSYSRQKELENRIARLKHRVRRLQCTQTITHTKQQLSAFTSNHPITHNGRQLADIDLGDNDLLLQKKYTNSISSGELIEIVNKFRENSTKLVSGPLTKVPMKDTCDIYDSAGQLIEQIHTLRCNWDSDVTEDSSGGECDPEPEDNRRNKDVYTDMLVNLILY